MLIENSYIQLYKKSQLQNGTRGDGFRVPAFDVVKKYLDENPQSGNSQPVRITEAQLDNMLQMGTFSSGQAYLVTLKPYSQLYIKYAFGDILDDLGGEDFIVTAASNSTLNPFVQSPSHANDIIIYDFVNKIIVYRHDIVNNIECNFDFRHQRIKVEYDNDFGYNLLSSENLQTKYVLSGTCFNLRVHANKDEIFLIEESSNSTIDIMGASAVAIKDCYNSNITLKGEGGAFIQANQATIFATSMNQTYITSINKTFPGLIINTTDSTIENLNVNNSNRALIIVCNNSTLSGSIYNVGSSINRNTALTADSRNNLKVSLINFETGGITFDLCQGTLHLIKNAFSETILGADFYNCKFNGYLTLDCTLQETTNLTLNTCNINGLLTFTNFTNITLRDFNVYTRNCTIIGEEPFPQEFIKWNIYDDIIGAPLNANLDVFTHNNKWKDIKIVPNYDPSIPCYLYTDRTGNFIINGDIINA